MSDPQTPRRQRSPSTTTLKALGQAAGEVAHDLDNALSAILTHATLLRGEVASPSALAHAEAIIRATKVAGDIVERVRGRLRHRAERALVLVDLGALLDDALVVARARAAPRGISIVRSTDTPATATLPDNVAGQPAELLQLVTNLVNNAVDASDPGGEVSVVLTSAHTPDGARVARLEVRDRGPGIPPALRERVFEPFFTTKGQAGTGLGLALAKSIAESHGGAIGLDSRMHGDRQGTTAIVELPLADATDASLRAPVPTGLELAGAGANAHVLIVDDDAPMREALGVLFDAAGFSVQTVAQSDQALHALAQRMPDLVITDLQLGGDDGAALVAALAAYAPELPIIVVSGAVQAHSGGDPAWRRHAWAIFDKPVSPGRLIATARELVARRRAAYLEPSS